MQSRFRKQGGEWQPIDAERRALLHGGAVGIGDAAQWIDGIREVEGRAIERWRDEICLGAFHGAVLFGEFALNADVERAALPRAEEDVEIADVRFAFKHDALTAPLGALNQATDGEWLPFVCSLFACVDMAVVATSPQWNDGVRCLFGVGVWC